VLIALHPFSVVRQGARALTGLDTLAARDGFLVGYPDSADLRGRRATPANGTLRRSDRRYRLSRRVIDDVSARYAVDTARDVQTVLVGGGTLAYPPPDSSRS